MRIGSLFAGCGGLDLAVQAVFGGEVVWHSEIDPAASKVLAYRFPGVPNLGDITKVDWADVPAVDVLCGGFPCQDVSAAGKRAGIKEGTRSGLWAVFAEAIDALRPQWVVVENVRGLLSAAAHRTVEDDAGDYLEPDPSGVGDGAGRPVLRAAGAVLGDLCDLGYDAQWATVAASSVGAPHRRERVFILATHAGYRDESERAWSAGWQAGERFSVGDVARRGGEVAAVSGDETGVALLPTPTAVQGRNETSGRKPGSKHNTGTTLNDVVFKGEIGNLLPTPCAQQSGNSPEEHLRKKPGRKVVTDLAILVENGLLESGGALLPTPQAFDQVDYVRTPEQLAEQAQRPNGGGARNLREVIVNELPEPTLLSTPQARGVCPQQAMAALRFLLSVSVAA